MYLLENVFTSEHGEAITVLQLLTKFKMTLTEIDKYLNEYGNRLNHIELKNFEQDSDLLVLKSQVASLQTKVNSIQLTLGDYLLRFNDLDVQLSVINGKIDINISDIAPLKTYVNNLGVQVIGINNTLNLLGLTVQGHTTQITNLESSVSSINSDLVDIDSSINLINTQLSNLANYITDFEIRLAVLETKVNNLFNTIDLTVQEHTTQISDLQTLSDTHSSDIVTIKEKNTSQDNSIFSINTSIGSIQDDINSINSKKYFTCSADYTIVDAPTVIQENYVKFFKYPNEVTNGLKCKIIRFSIGVSDSSGVTLTYKTPSSTQTITDITVGSTGIIEFEVKLIYNIVETTLHLMGFISAKGDKKMCFAKNLIATGDDKPKFGNYTLPLSNEFFELKSNLSMYIHHFTIVDEYNVVI